jgi:hypothetical protein
MSRSLLIKVAFLACILLMVPIYHDNVIIIIMNIMLLVKSSSNKKADVNVVCSSYVHQQDFNVPGLSWYSCVIWRLHFFGPLEFKPAARKSGLGFS